MLTFSSMMSISEYFIPLTKTGTSLYKEGQKMLFFDYSTETLCRKAAFLMNYLLHQVSRQHLFTDGLFC